MHFFSRNIIEKLLIFVWTLNSVMIGVIIMRNIWIPSMNADQNTYSNVFSEPFDGTSLPILYVPDWTKSANQDKSKRFENIPISEYVPLPLYDPIILRDAQGTNKASIIARYTYPTTYMGNYHLDYQEFAGGHPGVDIRAPLGTPVLSIANGVVVRISEGDATGNKFVVIRHDDIDMNGKKQTLYSNYLHLSAILTKAGDIVRKGDMIGRVGMTGIATTPHLHLQIDTSDAPFHPYWHFTSTESKNAGMGFFDAVSVGLNKDKALRYTIHPMTFVNTFLGGKIANATIPVNIVPPQGEEQKTYVSASAEKQTPKVSEISAFRTSDTECIGKRFSDVDALSPFGKSLYPLVDKKCIFSEKKTLNTKEGVTYREALINTMRYYDISPSNGTSHFLDIPLGDTMQGYALVAYKKGILDGSYAYPEKILTREEVARLIVSIAGGEKNPSQLSIYRDVDPMNPLYQAIQQYAFMSRARGGKFYPKTIATRGMFIQMLANIKQ